MKRESRSKCYRARVVTLIIVFRNIYQIFRPVTLEYMLITNYCLIIRVVNTLTALSVDFYDSETSHIIILSFLLTVK